MMENNVAMHRIGFKLKLDSSTKQKSEKAGTSVLDIHRGASTLSSVISIVCETVQCYQFTAVKSSFS